MARKKQTGQSKSRGIRKSAAKKLAAAVQFEALEGRQLLSNAPIVVGTTSDTLNDPLISIRDAVNIAAATPGDDVIQLNAGIYNLTNPQDDGRGYVSSMMRINDASGHLTIEPFGDGPVTIDANAGGRIFEIDTPTDLINLTLQNGLTSDTHDGGAIHVFSNLNVFHCTITGNSTANNDGGAIENEEDATTFISDSMISNNHAQGGGNGGAILNKHVLTVVNTQFVGNTADVRGGAIFNAPGAVTFLTSSSLSQDSALTAGGAIYNRGGVVNLDGDGFFNDAAPVGSAIASRTDLVDGQPVGQVNASFSRFTGNSATNEGGAIYASGGGVAIDNSLFDQNHADGAEGGAIENDGATLTVDSTTFSGNTSLDGLGGALLANDGSSTITRSTFSNNTARRGGAIHVSTGATLNVYNSTIDSNHAAQTGIGGGGIDNQGGTVTLLDSTVARNDAFGAGGLLNDSGSFSVGSSLIALNAGQTPDVTGDFTSLGYNLIGNADASTGFSAATDQAGATANPIDPKLGTLAVNGGPTMTDALLPASPALDQGNDFGQPTDQRGLARTFNATGAATPQADVGAFEAQALALGAIPNQAMAENTTLPVPINVTADAAVAAAAYTLSSNNTALLPPGSLTLSGAGNSLTLAITPALGQFGAATITIAIGNALENFTLTVAQPPAVAIAGPAQGQTGSLLSYTLSTVDPNAPANFIYQVDWGDGTTNTYSPVAGPANVTPATHIYASTAGSPYTIQVQAIGALNATGPLTTASVTITAPVVPIGASIAGPTLGVRGQSLAYALTATNASAAFTYSIDWGDGNTQTVTPLAGPQNATPVTHSYTSDAGSPYLIKVRAVPALGTAGPVATLSVTIAPVAVEPDPVSPGNLALFVGGTTGDDHIQLTGLMNAPGARPPGVHVTIDSGGGKPKFDSVINVAVDRIVVIGQDGKDNIESAKTLLLPAVIYAGNGGSHVQTGDGPTVIVGGDGADDLHGGKARSLLIGGRGADHLNAGGGDDILIGGATAYDVFSNANLIALSNIEAEWASGASLATRVAHINGTLAGGLNGASLLLATGSKQNVFDDNAVDDLHGGGGQDWFFAHTGPGGAIDKTDAKKGDVLTNT